jgi:hypothetical protein
VGEDFRVEVELDDEAHGYPLRERLRALNLDDEARERLGRNVVVTRDASRMFAYTTTEAQAREAENVISGLVADEGLSADLVVTRWHPVAEEWRDASLPLPNTAEEEDLEYEEREAAEGREAAEEGEFDWHVVAELRSRGSAQDLLRKLSDDEGLPVTRRWRYVTVGAVTEEQADELANRLRSELGDSGDVWVEAHLDEDAFRPFQFIGF